MSQTVSKNAIMGVQDQYFYSFLINGQPINLALSEGMASIWICQNIRQKLPFMRASVMIDTQSLQDATINDGTPIKVALNDGHSGLKNYLSFNAYGTPTRSPYMSGLHMLELSGVYDSTAYLYQTANTALQGSSTGVIANIASLMNLSYVTNDNSQDSMTWLPYKKTWADFTKYIAKHGWSDSKSIFSHGVGLNNTLYYINVQKQFENRTPVLELVYNTQPKTQNYANIIKYRIISRSGQFNYEGAYGMRTTQTNSSGGVTIYQQVSAAKNAGANLDISKRIGGSIQNRSKIAIAPMDAGNSHPNYIRARHQNERLKLTYSQNLYVLLNVETQLNLYDIVNVLIHGDEKKDFYSSGIYMVTALTKSIYGNFYYEKIELTNMGPSNTNQGLY
jgi:hypothetical protein